MYSQVTGPLPGGDPPNARFDYRLIPSLNNHHVDILSHGPCNSIKVRTLSTSCIRDCAHCFESVLLNSVGAFSGISLLFANHLKHFSSTMGTTSLAALMTRLESVYNLALTSTRLIILVFHIYVDVRITPTHRQVHCHSSGHYGSQ
jgi:hypothetical protein